MGDIVGDLNRRRGTRWRAWTTGVAPGHQGKVPLGEMFGYVTSLRTLSAVVPAAPWNSVITPRPPNVTEAVLAKVRGKVSA